jgi:hypothetical protein
MCQTCRIVDGGFRESRKIDSAKYSVQIGVHYHRLRILISARLFGEGLIARLIDHPHINDFQRNFVKGLDLI